MLSNLTFLNFFFHYQVYLWLFITLLIFFGYIYQRGLLFWWQIKWFFFLKEGGLGRSPIPRYKPCLLDSHLSTFLKCLLTRKTQLQGAISILFFISASFFFLSSKFKLGVKWVVHISLKQFFWLSGLISMLQVSTCCLKSSEKW